MGFKNRKKVYQMDGKNQKMKFMHYLTGYVPDEYIDFEIDLGCRDIDVGYRGSIQPLLFGQLAYEKREIGVRFAYYAMKRGLKCDISSRWEDRLMGDSWLDFLKRCKAVLGAESGSDIVDYTVEVKHQFDYFLKKHPKSTDK